MNVHVGALGDAMKAAGVNVASASLFTLATRLLHEHRFAVGAAVAPFVRAVRADGGWMCELVDAEATTSFALAYLERAMATMRAPGAGASGKREAGGAHFPTESRAPHGPPASLAISEGEGAQSAFEGHSVNRPSPSEPDPRRDPDASAQTKREAGGEQTRPDIQKVCRPPASLAVSEGGGAQWNVDGQTRNRPLPSEPDPRGAPDASAPAKREAEGTYPSNEGPVKNRPPASLAVSEGGGAQCSLENHPSGRPPPSVPAPARGFAERVKAQQHAGPSVFESFQLFDGRELRSLADIRCSELPRLIARNAYEGRVLARIRAHAQPVIDGPIAAYLSADALTRILEEAKHAAA